MSIQVQIGNQNQVISLDPTDEEDEFKEYFAPMQQFEIVVRFTCPMIKNQGKFYTDANGLELLERNLLNDGI
jgi:hypothetical protein